MEQNTSVNDGRWWHIEEYLYGRKALIIGHKMQINWYKDKEVKNQFKWFNSVDMFYWHIALFSRVLQFQYFHRI